MTTRTKARKSGKLRSSLTNQAFLIVFGNVPFFERACADVRTVKVPFLFVFVSASMLACFPSYLICSTIRSPREIVLRSNSLNMTNLPMSFSFFLLLFLYETFFCCKRLSLVSPGQLCRKKETLQPYDRIKHRRASRRSQLQY